MNCADTAGALLVRRGRKRPRSSPGFFLIMVVFMHATTVCRFIFGTFSLTDRALPPPSLLSCEKAFCCCFRTRRVVSRCSEVSYICTIGTSKDDGILFPWDGGLGLVHGVGSCFRFSFWGFTTCHRRVHVFFCGLVSILPLQLLYGVENWKCVLCISGKVVVHGKVGL